MGSIMKVGYVQTNPIFGMRDFNLEQVDSLLKNVKANLIVLPELFATGYTFTSKEEAFSLGEDVDGQTGNFLRTLSKKSGAIIVAGFAEKKGNNLYNAAMVAYKDEIIGVYRKLHLYYKEKKWFSPGNLPLQVVEIDGLKLGIMICFDWFFPETIRSLSLLGADIVAHPSNLVLPYCQKAMQTRCLVNRVYAITSNRIGSEKRGNDDFTFTGGSQITSYNGDILSSAPNDEIGADFVDIDTEKARDKNLNQFNNIFEDRRPKFYKL